MSELVNSERLALVSNKKSRSNNNAGKKFVLWTAIIIFLIVAAGTAGYYYNRYQNSQKEKRLSNPMIAAKQELQKLVNEVNQLTVLPAAETPTVATVTDVSKLSSQAFFTNAKNGDKVLIYTTSKKAYLYRPSTNKIINIAPVNIGSNQTPTSNP